MNIYHNKKIVTGKAYDMWVSIIIMPYCFLNRRFQNNSLFESPIWKMFSSLVELCRIITSSSFDDSLLTTLHFSIQQYLSLRILNFPAHKLTPKHHYLTHYPDLIKQLGPLSKMWTLRTENKHQYFKNAVRHLKNFINVEKSLSYLHQVYQSNLIGNRVNQAITPNKPEYLDPDMYNITIPNKYTMVAKKVIYGDLVFADSECIVMSVTDSNEISILKIHSIFLTEEKADILFYGKVCHMIYNYKQTVYEMLTDFSNYSLIHISQLKYSTTVKIYTYNNKHFLSLPSLPSGSI